MAVAVEQDGLVERVQVLTARLDEVEDLGTRMLAEELASSIVGLYGEGIERIFAVLAREGISAAEARDELVRDGVVASLMLIHGIYPVPLEDRVVEALDSVRPYMESHGGDVEFVGVEDGVAHLRLSGHCKGCAASASTLELAIEKALEDFAPDLLGLEVEGVVSPAEGHAPPGAVALPMAGERQWIELEGLAALARGAIATANETLLVANVAGTLLAYRDACAGCGARLSSAVLEGGTLTCGDARAISTSRAPGAVARTRTCSSSPCRCCARTARCGWRYSREHGRRVFASSRRGRRRGRRPGYPCATRRAASSARSASARTTATCSTWSSGGSSASARRAGRCARATPSSARPAAASSGSRTSRSPTSCGPRSRSRSASRS